MAAGSLRNVGEPKFRTPEVVSIGNNPPPTTPPGMFLAPIPPDTTWLDLQNREYSEFQISVDSSFHITTLHANEGARFRLFIYRSNDTEITVDINPWLDEVIKVPGTSVSKVYVLNVECYLVPGEEVLRYKVTNLIFDHQERKDKTWSSSKIKETINAVINDEEVSLTGTWSSTKLKQAIDAKQDKIESSLQVDEIVRKSNAEIGGLTFLSKSTHKDWGDREDQWPSFQFISRVFDGYGNVVFESIPLYLNGAGIWEAFKLNATSLTLNNLRVATESFVNAAIQAVTDLMSTDAERIAAINELTQNYSAADDQLEQTLTTALATKAGKAVNEEISGIYNFLNGLLENGVPLKNLYLGKTATAENSLKLNGVAAIEYLKKTENANLSGEILFSQALLTPPVKETTRINKYGITGNRKNLHITNGDAAGEINFNIGGDIGTGEVMRITSQGLAIGKSTPSEKLDVEGTILSSTVGQNQTGLAVKSSVSAPIVSWLDGKNDNNNFHFKFNRASKTFHLLYSSALAGNEVIEITSDKKVGIGKTPNEALDVNGNVKIIGTQKIDPPAQTGVNVLDLRTSGSAAEMDFSILLGREFENRFFSIKASSNSYFSGGATKIDIAYNRTGGYNHLMTIHQSGNVGIGTTTPSEALDVSGNIVASGTITNGSDRRQKSNIQPLTSRGELNPVTFIKNGKPDLGFIAQEVKELYPELVAGEETEDTYLSLNYSQLTAVLYAELKELRAEVKHLKQLIQNETNA